MFDFHIHSTYSDGSDNVSELIEKIYKSNIKYFSITDHDTALSAREIFSSENLKEKIKNYGMVYIPGIEFTCLYNNYKVHILAYDYDVNLKELKQFENEIKKLLYEKNLYRTQEIERQGYIFSQKSIEFMNTRENVRKIDVANCLVNDGYFFNISDAIDKVINNIKYPKIYRLDAEKVISTLSKLGVKMVWAHSLHGINEKPISFDEVENIVKEFKKMGLRGLECYYSLYNCDEIKKLIQIAKKYDLFITCGSDYHGKNKKVNLAEISLDGTTVDKNNIDIIKNLNNFIGKL